MSQEGETCLKEITKVVSHCIELRNKELEKLLFINPLHLVLPDLTSENALSGYMLIVSDNGTTAKLVNHILLIFKGSLYEMHSRKVAPSIFCIINTIKQIRDIEYQIAKKSGKLTLHFNKSDLLNLQAVNP